MANEKKAAKKVGNEKNKISAAQRKIRLQQVIMAIFGAIVILAMILSLAIR